MANAKKWNFIGIPPSTPPELAQESALDPPDACHGCGMAMGGKIFTYCDTCWNMKGKLPLSDEPIESSWEDSELDQPWTWRGTIKLLSYLGFGIFSGFAWYGLYCVVRWVFWE